MCPLSKSSAALTRGTPGTSNKTDAAIAIVGSGLRSSKAALLAIVPATKAVATTTS